MKFWTSCIGLGVGLGLFSGLGASLSLPPSTFAAVGVLAPNGERELAAAIEVWLANAKKIRGSVLDMSELTRIGQAPELHNNPAWPKLRDFLMGLMETTDVDGPTKSRILAVLAAAGAPPVWVEATTNILIGQGTENPQWLGLAIAATSEHVAQLDEKRSLSPLETFRNPQGDDPNPALGNKSALESALQAYAARESQHPTPEAADPAFLVFVRNCVQFTPEARGARQTIVDRIRAKAGELPSIAPRVLRYLDQAHSEQPSAASPAAAVSNGLGQAVDQFLASDLDENQKPAFDALIVALGAYASRLKSHARWPDVRTKLISIASGGLRIGDQDLHSAVERERSADAVQSTALELVAELGATPQFVKPIVLDQLLLGKGSAQTLGRALGKLARNAELLNDPAQRDAAPFWSFSKELRDGSWQPTLDVAQASALVAAAENLLDDASKKLESRRQFLRESAPDIAGNFIATVENFFVGWLEGRFQVESYAALNFVRLTVTNLYELGKSVPECAQELEKSRQVGVKPAPPIQPRMHQRPAREPAPKRPSHPLPPTGLAGDVATALETADELQVAKFALRAAKVLRRPDLVSSAEARIGELLNARFLELAAALTAGRPQPEIDRHLKELRAFGRRFGKVCEAFFKKQ